MSFWRGNVVESPARIVADGWTMFVLEYVHPSMLPAVLNREGANEEYNVASVTDAAAFKMLEEFARDATMPVAFGTEVYGPEPAGIYIGIRADGARVAVNGALWGLARAVAAPFCRVTQAPASDKYHSNAIPCVPGYEHGALVLWRGAAPVAVVMPVRVDSDPRTTAGPVLTAQTVRA